MPALLVALLLFSSSVFAFEAEFIGDFVLSTKLKSSKTPVGGISDLAFLNEKEILAVSDDRGVHGPERFYILDLSISSLKLETKKEITIGKNGSYSIDPEGIVLGEKNTLFISSEGDRSLLKKTKPGIFAQSIDGSYLWELPLSKVFWGGKKNGFQNNKGFESLAISPNKKFIYAANEEALKQDPRVFLRIAQYEISQKKETAQWTYPISKSKYNNGLVALMSLDNQRFLSLERKYIPLQTIKAKLFIIDCSKASDVKALQSLKKQKFEPCLKTELYDINKIEAKLKSHDKIDNLEGMALGPKDSKGWRTLLLAADDNFRSQQRNQFLLFRVKLD